MARRDDIPPASDSGARTPGSARPVPPTAKQQAKDLTVKQQREARRAEKVAALKKQQARQKRNRILGISIASLLALGAVVAIISFVIASAKPPIIDPDRDPAAISIEGVEEFTGIAGTHVEPQPVDYEAQYGMTPPAGGEHWSQWLNCGVYEQPVPNENAVHALEHGAVWTTYDPDVVSGDDLEQLRDSLPGTYSVLSPFPGLPAPVVMSGWGVQVQLDGVDDPRISDFLNKYWQSATVPEPGALCTGALDAPGKVS
ncbi:DUF3105 domain-containing protein [Planctomonas psychrotolerans]|uniref:DUF3105 domain-containing protein n=1 Tax=Planctomonas psychrotolerans TaxID=2528712 RepID=UPI001D0D58D7|nr:DUF3105 domain-containing protein [Planctomonas psychrotolerans]